MDPKVKEKWMTIAADSKLGALLKQVHSVNDPPVIREPVSTETLGRVWDGLLVSLQNAMQKQGRGAFASMHEALGAAAEEMVEASAAAHQNNPVDFATEMLQVAVAALWACASVATARVGSKTCSTCNNNPETCVHTPFAGTECCGWQARKWQAKDPSPAIHGENYVITPASDSDTFKQEYLNGPPVIPTTKCGSCCYAPVRKGYIGPLFRTPLPSNATCTEYQARSCNNCIRPGREGCALKFTHSVCDHWLPMLCLTTCGKASPGESPIPSPTTSPQG